MPKNLLSFPNPVDEVSARLVAGGVVVLALLTIVSGQAWLLAVIAVGFVLRVMAGPKLSPLALLMTKVVRPRVPARERLTPGPPKRFAQGMGATISLVAAVLALGFDYETAGFVLAATIVAAATLESVFGVCIGCKVFAVLMRLGVIPEETCEACANIWARQGA
jgi:hypothetical protein